VETDYRDVLGDWKSRLHLDRRNSIHDQLKLPLPDAPNKRLLHTKLIDFVKGVIAYPDAEKGWIPFATDALSTIARKHEVKAILSTAPPITCHAIAVRAKEMIGCPWLADFRDPVGDAHLGWEKASGVWGLRRAATKRYLKRTLSTADALVTVSEPLAERLSYMFPGPPTTCITNGFDPEDFVLQRKPPKKQFSITYTGSLYQGKRDPTSFLEVVAQMLGTGELHRHDLCIRFRGGKEPFLTCLVRRLELEDVVDVQPPIPRGDSLRLQAESQLLLSLEWNDPGEQGILSGKLFEYFGSRRPIISIGNDNGIAALVKQTRAGVQLTSRSEVHSYLKAAYAEYKQTGQVKYHGDAAAISKYTHREMAAQFAALLDQTVREPICA
jgi:hypothetical protein